VSEDINITPSSGNVFADLGPPHPEVLLAKAELAITITSVIRKRALTQTAAARELGVHQSRISAIMRGRLDDFSLERLLSIARHLGQDVSITLTPNPEPTRQGRLVAQRRDEVFAASLRE
jgi:predicted XRE-type DNA-binding protein